MSVVKQNEMKHRSSCTNTILHCFPAYDQENNAFDPYHHTGVMIGVGILWRMVCYVLYLFNLGKLYGTYTYLASLVRSHVEKVSSRMGAEPRR